jgi:hypothetical protein
MVLPTIVSCFAGCMRLLLDPRVCVIAVAMDYSMPQQKQCMVANLILVCDQTSTAHIVPSRHLHTM